MNTADQRAQIVALWEQASGDWPAVTRLTTTERIPEGHTAWAVGPWSDDTASRRQIVVQPTLDPAAPAKVHRRLLARVIALGSGRCPLCSQVASLTRQPPAPGEPRAPFHVFPLYVAVVHANGCPAEFREDERHLFPIFRTTNERTTP